IVRSPLMAARATFALKAGEWFRRGRLLMVSPVRGNYRRCQAEIPLIVLSRFPRPALYKDVVKSRYPDFRHLFILLTPDGIEPDDDDYIGLSYSEIADLVASSIDRNE